MPIFEYQCSACNKRYSTLVGIVAESGDERCPHCGGIGERRVSRFTQGRDEGARLDEMADRVELLGEPESGTDMRRVVREFGKGLDEDASDEMEEILESDLESDPGDSLDAL